MREFYILKVVNINAAEIIKKIHFINILSISLKIILLFNNTVNFVNIFYRT